MDINGFVISWNIGAQRIKGYTADEIIGQNFSCFYPEEARLSGQPQRSLTTAAAEGRFEDEGWRVRKDGTRFWASVVITPSRDADGQLTGFTKITRDTTQRTLRDQALTRANEELRHEVTARISAERRLHASEESLRRLSAHLLRTQEDERRRLGRDLHDNVGQYLAVLKMTLESLPVGSPSNDEYEAQLRECVGLVEDSIKEVRTMSYLLYPPMLDEMGLKSAVPRFLDGFTKRSGIQITFEMPKDTARLAHDTEIAIFRVLQESFDQRSPPFRERHSGDPHHRRRFRGPPGGQGSRQGNAAGGGGIDPRLVGHVRRRFAGHERTHAPIGRHAGNLVLLRRHGGNCRRSAPGLDGPRSRRLARHRDRHGR